MPDTSPLDNGIAVIHSNKLESLCEVLAYWVRQHALAPLENEIVLVQSNGMGQWLKQNLAQNGTLGIAASIQIQLPSLFIWSVYRAVLGQQIPKEQPLAKAPLTWRLYRLLPILTQDNRFEIFNHFLQHDHNQRKHHQLAEQLADLFDQYQVYRSDWLRDWAAGHDVLRNAHGQPQSLPEQHHWQPALWRAVLDDLGADLMPFASRDSVHSQFMDRIDDLPQRPHGTPRRIVLFGLSSLPQQFLEVLAKLGKFCQIILFVHNPCQHYWADIIEDKELLTAQRRRQTYKPGMASDLNPDQLHLHTNPLLAAWGKQGRDYIRLLDQFDETKAYAGWQWPEQKIDLFDDYGENGKRSLLQRIQQSILDLEPVPQQPVCLPQIDESMAFHIAHSPQREVEILHDQLLARFHAAAQAGEPLMPRDVIVMVPDINRYAPHIRAVFGQVSVDDPRYIPFSLADQQQRGENPLLHALETLLNLPESRFSVSEILGLLEVPALRKRFELTETAMPIIQCWLEQAGIRWGLNAEHRAQMLEMPADSNSNTWQFGLRRLLLGYAVGPGQALNGIEPYEDIGGLDAQWLGHLCHVIEKLEAYASLLDHELNVDKWLQTLHTLLDDFFVTDDERDRKILDQLRKALDKWQQTCVQGGFGEEDVLPLSVVREAWLSAVDEPTLQQRFLSGRVNFCTLMPMRAIPFRLVCLLGMNDGDYPRSQYPHGFDLMSQRGHYRPGDRSRRQDDQYLFLEALLSARQQLYISWVGRSIRDNSEKPPSVLVSQLRDFIEQSYCLAHGKNLLAELTTQHPLQPFSLEYIKQGRPSGLFTYAREWFEAKAVTDDAQAVCVNQFEEKTYNLEVEALARFLRAPVKTYCQQSLKLSFEKEAITNEDVEPFNFNPLQSDSHSKNLLEGLIQQRPDDIETFFANRMTALAGQGKLPLGGFSKLAFTEVARPVAHAWQRYQECLAAWPTELDPRAIELMFTIGDGMRVQVSCGLTRLRQTRDTQRIGLITPSAKNLLKKDLIQYPNLLLPWLQHLAACAHGLKVESHVVGANGMADITPLSQAESRDVLQSLVEAWYQGLQTPLPIACRTAFVWLNSPADKALAAAQAEYEGNDRKHGELDYDPYLARFFPDFSSLYHEQGHFEMWAERLYRPLCTHIHIK